MNEVANIARSLRNLVDGLERALSAQDGDVIVIKADSLSSVSERLDRMTTDLESISSPLESEGIEIRWP